LSVGLRGKIRVELLNEPFHVALAKAAIELSDPVQ